MSTKQVLEEMTLTELKNEKKPHKTHLTRQTGQVLMTFGMIFKHVPPFNETIDENTGETLICLGKKLLSK